MILFYLLAIAEGEACIFDYVTSLSSSFANAASPMRYFAKEFGVEVSTEFPQLNSKSTIKTLMPYIYGLVGIAIVIVFVVVVLILIFFVAQIAACFPCTKPQRSNNPSLQSFLIHITICVVCVVSLLLFYTSAAKITVGFNRITDAVPEINETVSNILGIIDNSVNNASLFIDDTLQNAIFVFTEFIRIIEEDLSDASKATKDVIDNIRIVEKTINETLYDYSSNFDSKINNLKADCPDLPTFSLHEKIKTLGKNMVISELKTRGIGIAAELLEYTKEEVKSILGNVKGVVTDEVDKFVNKTVPKIVLSLHNRTDGIVEFADPLEDIIISVKNIVNPIIYTALFILDIICVIYGIVFFMKNCFSRAFACSYSTFAIIICLIIGLPSVAFSAGFYILYDICPQIEPQITNIGKDFLGEESRLGDILICSDSLDSTSIYVLANLKQFFDYKQPIIEANNTLQGTIERIDVDQEVYSELNLTASIDLSDFDPYLFSTDEIKQYLSNFKETGKCPTFSNTILESMKKDLDEIGTSIDSIAYDFAGSKATLKEAISLAKNLPPDITYTAELTKTLVKDFTNGTLDVIDTFLDGLNCKLICNIYAPAKNALCVSLVDSMAYWLVASLLMALAVCAFGIQYCIRRKSMLSSCKVHSSISLSDLSDENSVKKSIHLSEYKIEESDENDKAYYDREIQAFCNKYENEVKDETTCFNNNDEENNVSKHETNISFNDNSDKKPNYDNDNNCSSTNERKDDEIGNFNETKDESLNYDNEDKILKHETTNSVNDNADEVKNELLNYNEEEKVVKHEINGYINDKEVKNECNEDYLEDKCESNKLNNDENA